MSTATLQKMYLVMGSNPCEDPTSRTFYTEPNVFLLDNQCYNDSGLVVDMSRFFVVDMSSPRELSKFSSGHARQFDEICFDWSTIKFFNFDFPAVSNVNSCLGLMPPCFRSSQKTDKNTELSKRIGCLAYMLKPGGKIYFESIDEPPGGGRSVRIVDGDIVRDETDYSALFTAACVRAGLDLSLPVHADKISGSYIVPKVFMSGMAGREQTLISVATLEKTKGGNRRIRKNKTRARNVARIKIFRKHSKKRRTKLF